MRAPAPGSESSPSGARTPRRLGWLLVAAVLLLPPLFFYGEMVVRGWEPTAADTQAAQVFSKWGLDYEAETGEVPDWYPYIFGGMPSYGSFIYTPRSPINPVGWFHSMVRGNRGLYYVFLLFLTGLSTFALLRRQGLSRTASVTGGLFLSLTPYMPGVVAAGHSTKLEALCLLPGFLLALDMILDRPTAARAALLAFTGVLLAWTNHPQVAFYGFIVGFLYALGRILWEKSWKNVSGYLWKLPLLVVLALILAGAMAAEPYLAVQEYTPYSIRGEGGDLAAAGEQEGGVGWDYATAWSFHPAELISFLFPSWFGLQDELYWGKMPFTHSTHYVGIAALALAVVGLWRLRGPRRWIWAGISLVVLLIGFGRHLPVLYGPMFHLVPFFDRFRVPSMIYGILPLTLVYLVAGGMDAMLDLVRGWSVRNGAAGRTREDAGRGRGGAGSGKAARRSGESRPPRGKPGRESASDKGGGLASPRTRLILWMALAAVGAAWILFSLVPGMTGSTGFTREADARYFTQPQIAMVREARIDLYQTGIAHAFLILGGGVVLLLLGAYGFLRGRYGAGVLGATLALLVVGDLYLVGTKFLEVRPRPVVEETIPLPGASRYLAGLPGTFRILPASDGLMGANALGVLGLESVGGYHAAKLHAFQDLRDRDLILSLPVLRMLNVRYILSPEPLRWDEPALYEGDGYVYPFPDSLPRAWSVHRVEELPDSERMFRRLGDPAFDPDSTALLYAGSGAGIARGEYSPAQVVLKERGTGRLVLETESEGEAFVVVSEMAFPPGWNAWIGSSPASLVRVNHVLQGLVLPAGRHEVRLEAVSPARVRGMWLSRTAAAATWILALVSLGLGYVRSRKRGSSRS